jgi:hypothetical protein
VEHLEASTSQSIGLDVSHGQADVIVAATPVIAASSAHTTTANLRSLTFPMIVSWC